MIPVTVREVASLLGAEVTRPGEGYDDGLDEVLTGHFYERFRRHDALLGQAGTFARGDNRKFHNSPK